MARSEIGEWMPFEIDRFFGSPRVQQMKDFQKWWYVSLLLRAWQSERPCHLPDSQNELMILAGATSEASWRAHSAAVLGMFDVTGDGYRVNRRQLEIYEEKKAVREVNKLNGLKGGRPKKTETKPNGNRTVSGPSNSSSDLESALKEKKFELPIWVPEKAWLAFLQMRQAIKKPPTEEAKARLVIKLEKLMQDGHNPEAVLWESVTNGWAGLFPLKKDTVTAVKNEPLKWKAKASE